MRTTKTINAYYTSPKLDGASLKENFFCYFGISTYTTGYAYFDLTNEAKPYTIKSISAMLRAYGTNEIVVEGPGMASNYVSTTFNANSYSTQEVGYECSDDKIEYSFFPYYQYSNDSIFYGYASENPPYIEIETVTPEISMFDVTGTSIDNNITCSWTMADVTSWKVEAIKENIVKATKTGTTETSCVFNQGDLLEGGEYTFKITVYYGSSFVEDTKTVTLSYTQSTISLLELPGSSVNIDEIFTISWVSSNQSSFELEVDNKKYTGTTQTSVIIPAGSISKGNKTVNLTITYNGQYYSNIATATDSFFAYGKPSTPTLTLKNTYSSANPTLTWLSDEQTAYNLSIKRQLTTVEETGDVISTNKYYTTTAGLDNNYTYTVALKIKNSYGLWSDTVEASFEIMFIIPPVPSITAIADVNTGSIILNVNTTTNSEYKNTEIWKREPSGIWKRVAYKLNAIDSYEDFYVAGNVNYEYKARNIGNSGGTSESDIITTMTKINGARLYNVEDTSKYAIFETGENPQPKINQNIVGNMFAGANSPMYFSDGTLYWTCTMTFKFDDITIISKIYELLQAKLLLYKDNKGHKLFGNIINSPDFTEDDVNDFTVTLEFSQSQFIEEDLYCGDNLQLITWNGAWKFDGTHTLGGE